MIADQDRRAIGVPLTTVGGGMSQSVAVARQARSEP
jgi:hypothetical protein